MTGNWRKKLGVMIAALFVILAGAAAFFAFQMTRPIQPEWQGKPGAADFKSAQAKFKLLATAQERGARGFIHLNEMELNSLITEHFFTSKTNFPPNTNPFGLPSPPTILKPPPLPEGVTRTAVTLSQTNLALYFWERREIMGYEVSFVWKRVMVPEKKGDKWDFKLSEMDIGDVQIPKRFWDYFNKHLQDADDMFRDTRKWINALPWIEIGTVETNTFGEAKLYTYVPMNKGSMPQAQP